MTTIRVETVLGATPDAVWADVADISTHTEWMEDAVAITFTSTSTEGVGTTFDCATKVGPIRLTDKMAVTEWSPPTTMGVRHEGLVAGDGVFTISPAGDGRSLFTWEEQLHFPWWLGGPIGERLGAPVLRFIWRRNLANLRARFS